MKLYGSKGRTIDVEFCLDTRLVAYGRALDPGRRRFAPSGPSGFRTYGPRPWGRCRETGEPCTASRRPGEPAHTAESPRYRTGRPFLRRHARRPTGRRNSRSHPAFSVLECFRTTARELSPRRSASALSHSVRRTRRSFVRRYGHAALSDLAGGFHQRC